MLIAERYRVIERLGAGGMATVLLAEDERLGRRVALKRLHPGVGPEVAGRFRREARLGASLTHPNVVSVYDVIAHEDQVVLVMEYVEGRTLAEVLSDGKLGPEGSIELLLPLAAALDHAHAEGVVHRDVKPANILVRVDGAAKLADLGIATGAELTSVTATGTALGTVTYMAPEQLEGKRVTAAADVYALATVAFEMLSGRKARTGATPMEIVHRMATEGPPDLCTAWPEAPAEAGESLRRAMSPQPAERPRSAGELVRQLAEALDAERGMRETQDLPRTAPIAAPPSPAAPSRTGAPPGTPSRPTVSGWSGPATPPAVAQPRLPAAPLPTRAGAHRPPSRRTESLRRRRAATIVALGLLVALVVAGAVVAIEASHDESPSASEKPRKEAERVADDGTATSTAPPAEVARAFYDRAAADRYQAAWSLAAPSLRAQLGGFNAFKADLGTLESITFDRAETTSETADRSTVAIATTAVHTDRTDSCRGEMSLSRHADARGWLIDRVAVDC